MQELESICKTCMKCELSKTRTNVVFGKGNIKAKILFIGEAPGKNEDIQGIPFVGAAGKELDKLLNKIGLSLDDAYIANILKCRPPENRNPNNEEIKLCTPYLIEQIKLINPEVICTLGNYSTKLILAKCNPDNMKSIEGITKLHGKSKIIVLDEKEVKVIPIYHPAAMLYNPKLRETMSIDFEKIKEEINCEKKNKKNF
ncbi:uracil-DNA glycosylase [Candidatus Woesearchaeota archaeon]|nr:uracil-DNA glycosylase [Candidatus Woesearchaeota archaeon]